MLRGSIATGAITIAALLATGCGGSRTALPTGDEQVSLDPAEFTAAIDNPYWPMTPGTQWVYRDTAADGTEQRVSLRAKPRRSLEFSILVGRDDAALLDVLLSAWQSRVYALPIWPDKTFLSATITAGSTVIPITTTNLEYEADGLLVIGSDSRNTEAAEVLSVASNAVTLKQPLLQTWPAGAFVAPARTARLRVTQAVSKVTDAIATAYAAVSDDRRRASRARASRGSSVTRKALAARAKTMNTP